VSFGLLILAHLVGDYILQNDWMAREKGAALRVGLSENAREHRTTGEDPWEAS